MAFHNGIGNIGMITSGGDCGGLNAVIKGVGSTANALGISAYIIPNGYAGLYNLVDFNVGDLVELTQFRMTQFGANVAGAESGHSRVKISGIKDEHKYERIKEGLRKHSIDALVVSGGDDSGLVAHDLASHGFPVNQAPKTMDLDLQCYSAGGDSAINAVESMAGRLKTTGQTHNRIIVLEVFGRYTGHIAFGGGIAGDADCILIPEITPNFDVVFEHLYQRYSERIMRTDNHKGWYLIVTAEAMKGNPEADNVDDEGFLVDISKGMDAFGHYPLIGSGKRVEDEIKRRLRADPRIGEFMRRSRQFVPGQYEIPEVRVIRPTHLVRSGSSSGYDVNFGKEVGSGAVRLLKESIFGMTVTGVHDGVIEYMPIADAIQKRHVNLERVVYHESMGVCFGREPEAYVTRHRQLPQGELPSRPF